MNDILICGGFYASLLFLYSRYRKNTIQKMKYKTFLEDSRKYKERYIYYMNQEKNHVIGIDTTKNKVFLDKKLF